MQLAFEIFLNGPFLAYIFLFLLKLVFVIELVLVLVLVLVLLLVFLSNIFANFYGNYFFCSGLDESDTINRHKFGYSKRSQSEESNEESDNGESLGSLSLLYF